MEKLRYKMYALNIYQLKDIQQGIQAQHAISRYEYVYRDNPEVRAAYDSWIQNDQTTIILNGGTCQSLKNIIQQLTDNDIPHYAFQESDLDMITTSVALLADERVWDFKKYAYPANPVEDSLLPVVGGFTVDSLEREAKRIEEFLGGKKNVFLRQLLSPMRTI
jgi:hypothetical protein